MTTVTELYNKVDLTELRREPLFSSLTDEQLKFSGLIPHLRQAATRCA